MATVAVTIAGRTYRMACGEGEEAHLRALGRHVDDTLAGLRRNFGEIGDTRLVVMAAITLADDLFDARRRAAELEAELAAAKADGEARRDALAAEMTGSLDAAAERLERLAARLGGSDSD